MDKVGNAVMKLARSRGEIVPRDFAAAVKDIKLAILQSRARAAHASNVEAPQLLKIRHLPSDESRHQRIRPTSLGESVIRQSSTDELATCKWRNVISFNSTIAKGRKPHDSLPRSSKVSAANSPTGSRNGQNQGAVANEI